MNKDQKIYVKEDDVNFRKQSESVDGIQKMKRGQELIIVDGPWLRVTKEGQQGWVRSDYISETSVISNNQNVSLLPVFIIGKPNLAKDDNTKKIREIIADALNGAKNGYALQCTEYVSYRVKLLGIDINWPVKSGRNGGVWWKIFKNAGLYTILPEPKANCAMCFTAGISKNPETNAIGHVAFVEDVLPDWSVRISEANSPPLGENPQGQYNTRTISKEKWQNQYKAQFISFQ